MRIIFILLLLTLFSCGQKQWTTRGTKKGWIKSDTIVDTLITHNYYRDTIFKSSKDTVILKDNKLTVKYFYNTTDSTIYLSGKCESDTIRIERIVNTISPMSGKWYDDYIYWIIIAFLLFVLWVLRKQL